MSTTFSPDTDPKYLSIIRSLAGLLDDIQQAEGSAALLSPNVAEYFEQLYVRVLQGQTMRFNHTGLDGREYAMVVQPVRTKKGVAGVSVIGRDVTEVHRLQVELRHFEQVISSTPDLIAVIDRNYHHQIVNDAYVGAFNKTREELLKLNLKDLFGERSFQHDALLNLEIAFSGETVHSESWVELPELRHLATTDPLIGARNRRSFLDQVNVELKRSRRHGLPLAVLLLDIDHFKSVNDTYGHDIGDEVLNKLVDCCHEQLRDTDLFGRFGGEEFAAALVQTDSEGALQVCERLREEIKKIIVRTRQGEVEITASIGLTMLTSDDLSIDPVLKRADDALYRAKNGGRDQVVLY